MKTELKAPQQRPSWTKPQWNIAVLAGGPSAEREISLQSGADVAAALATSGHRIVPIDPLPRTLSHFDWSEVDVAFLALHGAYGEDGGVQSELQSLRVPYTGSGPQSSASAFHKLMAKRLFDRLRLPTPAWHAVSPSMDASTIVAMADELAYPVVVKPEAQGSSLGISIVRHPSELATAIERARACDSSVFIEKAIPGEEWTVPVFDGQPWPPIRITPSHDFFDFNSKYIDEQTRYDVFDVEHSPRSRLLCEIAVHACLALGCRGMCRVDLRVGASGDPWLLEVNTVPGMTSHSLVPKSAAHLGWDFSRLCEELIRSALAIRN